MPNLAGYYWVKLSEEDGWSVAYKDKKGVWATDDGPMAEVLCGPFYIIGPRLLPPDES